MGPDTVLRHEAVAKLLSTKGGTVLDVGGNRGELAQFTRGIEVTSVNVEGEDADLTFDGEILPFGEDTFDAVVSLDVLEHIPRSNRGQHVSELLRVSRSETIICCPLGSPSHIAAEREVAEEYGRLTGGRHRFLDEHLALGLPTWEELMGIAAKTGLEFEFLFQGDFRVTNQLFLDGVRLKGEPRLGSAGKYLASRRRAYKDDELTRQSTKFSNRVFLRILNRAANQ